MIGDSLFDFLFVIGVFVFLYLCIQYFSWLKAEGLIGGIRLAIYVFLFLLIFSSLL